MVGIPFYGRSFTLANPANNSLNAPSVSGGQPGRFTRAVGFLSYYEICYKIRKEGWTMVQDEEGAMGPYAYKGNQWVGFDDIDIIRRKVRIIDRFL